MPYLLGIDIGTLGLKAVLVDTEGHILAAASSQHGVSYPRPGWAEQNPEKDWWGEFLALVKKLLTRTSIDTTQIISIGISGLVPALCTLDRGGRPLRPAILYCDNRAGSQLRQLREVYGLKPTMEQVLPKLFWVKDHEPELYDRIYTILNPHSYIVYRLTDRVTIDYDSANIFGGLFNPEKMNWEVDLCKTLGIDPQILPVPLPATAVAGKVTPTAAALTGLAAGTPVIVGTGDSYVTLMSAGVTEPGEMMLYLGTAGTAILVRQSLAKASAALHISNQPETVEFCANILACGQAISWYSQLFFPETPTTELFTLLEKESSKIPAGSEGLYFLPHLMGRRLPAPEPLAHGTLFGLTPSHGRYHFFRALLEGIAYEFRSGYLAVKNKVTRIVIAGGGARNTLWRQIISDVLEREVAFNEYNNTSLGTAYLAGYAVGLYPDFQDLREKWNPVRGQHTPRPREVTFYQQAFSFYRELNQGLEHLYKNHDI